MNLVGKILTVFICVAAIVFACFAVAVYATHKNWKQLIDNPDGGYKEIIANARKRTDDLRTELANKEEELAQERLAKKEALTKLEDRLDTLQGEYEIKSKECDAKTEEARVATAAVKTSNDESAALRVEVTDLRAKRIAAERARDDYSKQVVQLTDDIHQKVNELKRLKERQKDLADELADALAVCRIYGLVPKPEIHEGEPPILDGVVQGIAPGNLVEIWLGSDEGLLQGHKLLVVRRGGGGAKFVGRIEVMKTAYDKSACKIIEANLPMQPGDLVYTVIPGQARLQKKQPAKG